MEKNPIFAGSVSLISGNLLGSSVSRLVALMDARLDFGLSGQTKKFVDLSLKLAFHVGLLSLGTHFMSNAFPFLTEDPSAFTLYGLGLIMTSTSLADTLNQWNGMLRAPQEAGNLFATTNPNPKDESKPL